jgi:hypothetical protein
MADISKKGSPISDSDESMAMTAKDMVSVQVFHTLSPKKLGSCLAMCYRNGNPLVTIGPNCNLLSRASIFLCSGNSIDNIIPVSGVHNVA